MCNVDVNFKVQYIKKQFLACVPISNIQWSNIFDYLKWEDQEILLSNTINSDLVLKYPIKFGYQKSFLKFVIQQLEEKETEVHDCVYDAFGRLVTLTDSSECFKHYLIEKDRIITLKENPNIISEGTTGLCSWQASFALSEWCLSHKDIFTDKTILELGSGIGLTGITIALNCRPEKIYLTDCHHSVLQVLCSNIKLNIGESVSNLNQNENPTLLSETVISSKTTIEVLNLPWETISEKTCKYVNPDLLLAADVIYDSSLNPSLINAVSCFLGPQNTKELIIACTERNTNTLEEFLNLLVTKNLRYRELDLIQQKNFFWSTECPIRLFSIQRSFL